MLLRTYLVIVMGCGSSTTCRVADLSKSNSSTPAHETRNGAKNIRGDRVSLADARAKRKVESRERIRRISKLASEETEKAKRCSSRTSSSISSLRKSSVHSNHSSRTNTPVKNDSIKTNGHYANDRQSKKKNEALTKIVVTECSDESDTESENKVCSSSNSDNDDNDNEKQDRINEMKFIYQNYDSNIDLDNLNKSNELNSICKEKGLDNNIEHRTTVENSISENNENNSKNLDDTGRSKDNIVKYHAYDFVNDVLHKAKDQYQSEIDCRYSNESFDSFIDSGHTLMTQSSSKIPADDRANSVTNDAARELIGTVLNNALVQVQNRDDNDTIKLENELSTINSIDDRTNSETKVAAKELIGNVLNNALFQVQNSNT